jgi:serine O-acetyltransferase
MDGEIGLFLQIKSDLFRYECGTGPCSFVRVWLTSIGFRASMAYRLSRWLKLRCPRFLYLPLRFFILLLSFSSEKELPSTCLIGSGLRILHGGSVVLNSKTVIGENCTLSQGVTIGITLKGRHPGAPFIGDRVYIAPNAVIIGAIKVGNDVAIGANALVNSDVPDGACVGGVPARILSQNGSGPYAGKLWNNSDKKKA